MVVAVADNLESYMILRRVLLQQLFEVLVASVLPTAERLLKLQLVAVGPLVVVLKLEFAQQQVENFETFLALAPHGFFPL